MSTGWRSARVGMIAWWSVTLASLTTRPSGSTSSPSTYCEAFAYSGWVPTSAAIGLISGIMSPVRYREFVLGYVSALCSSYRRWAAASVRLAVNP